MSLKRHTARVTGRKAGRITFPLVGKVELAGLDKGEAEARLAKPLRDGKFVMKPNVNVLVLQYRSQHVSVLPRLPSSSPGTRTCGPQA